MAVRDIRKVYFEWLIEHIKDTKHFGTKSYYKLLNKLHQTEFIYFIDMDSNRARDGVGLRDRFADDINCSINTVHSYLDEPCSVLEMMIALSLRCEETIMTAPDGIDKTHIWFWQMINSLGLSRYSDKSYNELRVDTIIDRFLNRNYEPNGNGGLFIVECGSDLRKIDIWYQMLWYLDSIT